MSGNEVSHREREKKRERERERNKTDGRFFCPVKHEIGNCTEVNVFDIFCLFGVQSYVMFYLTPKTEFPLPKLTPYLLLSHKRKLHFLDAIFKIAFPLQVFLFIETIKLLQ